MVHQQVGYAGQCAYPEKILTFVHYVNISFYKEPTDGKDITR